MRDRENNFICSQSFEQRPLKEYYFNVNREYSAEDQVQGFSDNPVPTLRTTLIYRTNIQYAQSALGEILIPAVGETEIRVDKNLRIEEGDVLAFSYLLSPSDTDRYENILVQSVNHYSASVSGAITATTASISRNYLSEYDDNTNEQSWRASNYVALHKYTPDTIYSIEDNQPYKIRNKKLWVQDSNTVFYVDGNGQMVAISKEC